MKMNKKQRDRKNRKRAVKVSEWKTKAKAFTEAHQDENIDEILAEMRGEQILANSAQTCKIENYQEEGWYSSGDDEYICGISFDEPIKLPVEFYYKKKEANNEQERTEDIR